MMNQGAVVDPTACYRYSLWLAVLDKPRTNCAIAPIIFTNDLIAALTKAILSPANALLRGIPLLSVLSQLQHNLAKVLIRFHVAVGCCHLL